jgi:hypothetical protein
MADADHRVCVQALLVGSSVAPVQEMRPYAPVVYSEALAMGGVCGAVSRCQPEAIMRLHQRFPFRQQGGAFRIRRRFRDAASRLRSHAAPVLPVVRHCGQAAQGQPRRCLLSTSAVPSSSDRSARAVSSCRRMSASRCSRSAMSAANTDACEARESSRRRSDGAMGLPSPFSDLRAVALGRRR